MSHERKGGHFRRQYSAQAKKAGEAMMKVMRDFAEPLSVQDARDACTFCRNILESQVRGCPYNGRSTGSRGGSGCGCKR